MGNCLKIDNKNCLICKDDIEQPKYLHCKKCNLNYHFVCLLHATRGVECCTQCYTKLHTIKVRESFVYTNNRSLSINTEELDESSELTFLRSNSYKSTKKPKYGKAYILNQ